MGSNHHSIGGVYFSIRFLLHRGYFLPFYFFTLFIYRNPERILEEDDELSFVAPIDGKIMDISKVSLRDGSEMLSVIIKKTIWDVGIIRAPMAMSIVGKSKKIWFVSAFFFASFFLFR